MEHTRIIDGRYRLLHRIGTGGMAEVYEAEHRYTRQRVALKFVPYSRVALHPEIEAITEAEASVCAAVEHPAVVHVIDAGRTDTGDLYVAFELLAGQDLESAFFEGRLTPSDVVRVAVETAQALGAVHRAGFVHRDIKPANVFLANEGGGRDRVKLLDFGVARALDCDHLTGCTVGTLEYMSPEQAMSESVDARSDIYGLGAVMFRGLTGRPPHRAESVVALVRDIVREPPPPTAELRPDLPEELCFIVDRCLSRHPEDRWQSVQDLGQALLLIDQFDLNDLAAPGDSDFDSFTCATECAA